MMRNSTYSRLSAGILLPKSVRLPRTPLCPLSCSSDVSEAFGNSGSCKVRRFCSDSSRRPLRLRPCVSSNQDRLFQYAQYIAKDDHRSYMSNRSTKCTNAMLDGAFACNFGLVENSNNSFHFKLALGITKRLHRVLANAIRHNSKERTMLNASKAPMYLQEA